MDIKELKRYAKTYENIAQHLNDDVLVEIGNKVFNGYTIDIESRDENGWNEKNKTALKLAMQVEEAKTYPFPKAANVKYPLVAMACIQFGSRVISQVIPKTRIVKCVTTGSDPKSEKAKRATRISTHMTWELKEKMDDWEGNHDKMLTSLGAVGCMFKKVYRNNEYDRNEAECIFPNNLVVHYFTKSLKTAARITHVYEMSPNTLEEKKRSDFFLDIEVQPATGQDENSKTILEKTDNRPGYDPEAPVTLLEQHRWLDLDEDGYQEPYIVTIDQQTKQVLRIVTRFEPNAVKMSKDKVLVIKPNHYFVKYGLIPATDGSFYDIGFGHLLAPINKAINQTLNLLLDAGHRSILPGGFLTRGIQLGKGRTSGFEPLRPGEWRPLNIPFDDIKKGMYEVTGGEPSGVLFSLLGFLEQAGKQLSSVTDIMSGSVTPAETPATTTLAMIEQGMKVFSAIYMRIFKAMTLEFKMFYSLNSIYLKNEEEIFRLSDTMYSAALDDYNMDDLDVLPVADPSEITDTQKMLKAQALLQLLGKGYNDDEIYRRWCEAMEIPDPEAILQKQQMPEDPRVTSEKEKLAMERANLEFEFEKYKDTRIEIITRAIKNIADAEAKEQGLQLDIYRTELERLLDFNQPETQGGGQGGQPQEPGQEGQQPGQPQPGQPQQGSEKALQQEALLKQQQMQQMQQMQEAEGQPPEQEPQPEE